MVINISSEITPGSGTLAKPDEDGVENCFVNMGHSYTPTSHLHCLSIYIYLSIDPSIHLSIYQSIGPTDQLRPNGGSKCSASSAVFKVFFWSSTFWVHKCTR